MSYRGTLIEMCAAQDIDTLCGRQSVERRRDSIKPPGCRGSSVGFGISDGLLDIFVPETTSQTFRAADEVRTRCVS